MWESLPSREPGSKALIEYSKIGGRWVAGYRRKRGRSIVKISLLTVLAVGIAAGIYAAYYWNLFPKKTYTAEYFGIETVKSTVDFDKDEIDDYTDIVLGARKDAKEHPRYDGRYWATAYPPDNIGVCTDVVWRAFKNAGYSLKDMVDKDVEGNLELYPMKVQDKNIDFRRVPVLKVFFSRYAQQLTLDIEQKDEWQPGDIVIFKDSHIGIISDKRNKQGISYLIHNGGQPRREEDFPTRMEISGHYRFDASLIPSDMLIPFRE